MRVLAATSEGARYYGYRVAGPFCPSRGQRFDDQKILLDPYATGVFFPPGRSRVAACKPASNAGEAPLGVLPPRKPISVSNRPPGPRYGHDLVVYEMHVRGFTQRKNSGVPDAARGTFAGIVAKIPYLRRIGVTAFELLPVQQFDPQEGNYWGYMTLDFFAPHLGYARTARRSEWLRHSAVRPLASLDAVQCHPHCNAVNQASARCRRGSPSAWD
jgi:isoamylase